MSEAPDYGWRRFRCPTTGRINLTDGGYLVDPNRTWGRLLSPDVVPFHDISAIPCLALLGEPGIGKTWTMRAEWRAAEAAPRAAEDKTLWFDLSPFGDEDRLVRELFGCDAFRAWDEGTHHLHVFLEAFDECRLRIAHLSAVLLSELSKYSIDRLFLRIACRTAEWPSSFEQGLRRLWGHDGVGLYGRVPLRRKDVAAAATVSGLDATAFLGEVDRAGVVPLAIKPVTLNFLLRAYGIRRRLPSSRSSLYADGCRYLAEEPDQRRMELGLRAVSRPTSGWRSPSALPRSRPPA